MRPGQSKAPLSCWCKVTDSEEPPSVSGQGLVDPALLDRISYPISCFSGHWLMIYLCPVVTLRFDSLSNPSASLTWCTLLPSQLYSLSLSGKYFRLNSWANTLSVADILTWCHTSCSVPAPGAAEPCKVAPVVERFSAYLWTAWFSEAVVNVTAQTEWIISSSAVQIMAKIVFCCRPRITLKHRRLTHTHKPLHLHSLFVRAVRSMTQRAMEVLEPSPNCNWGGEKHELVRKSNSQLYN